MINAMTWAWTLSGTVSGPGGVIASNMAGLQINHAGHGTPGSTASSPLSIPLEPPADDDTGGWRWEMPEQQDDLAVNGDGQRVCMNCGGERVVQGVSAAKLGGKWVAYFCKHCAPHLSVRNNAQVPVTWTGPTANITGDLTMLPLYKRCQRCRKWATFGPPGPRGVKRHCHSHAIASEVPVHRRKCEAPECKKRPSFAPVGDSLPLRCATHKRTRDMDVSHSRCLHRDFKGSTTIRCWRTPTYGFKDSKTDASGKRTGPPGGGAPQMCWEHKSVDMVQVFVGKCRHKGCSDAPLYARPAERKLSFCEKHRREGDVCVAEGYVADVPRAEPSADGGEPRARTHSGRAPGSVPSAAALEMSSWAEDAREMACLSNTTLASPSRHRYACLASSCAIASLALRTRARSLRHFNGVTLNPKPQTLNPKKP